MPMDLDVLGMKQGHLIEGIGFGGPATFIEYGLCATITLIVRGTRASAGA